MAHRVEQINNTNGRTDETHEQQANTSVLNWQVQLLTLTLALGEGAV